jgi:hypothetical protein
MLKKFVLAAFIATLAVPAFAQDPKAEVGFTLGWVFSDGVSSTKNVTTALGTFNRIDPLDSFGWSLDFGFFIGPNAEIGFLYAQQPTKLEAGGTNNVDIGTMGTHTYHGTYTYNFGPGDARIRPYVLAGLGATSFSTVDYTTNKGVQATLPGASRFSTTWGAGVKVYGAGKVGGRFGLRYTPAYIKSDATGYWCDPYWGCYLTGDAQYASQFEINGGVTFKF